MVMVRNIAESANQTTSMLSEASNIVKRLTYVSPPITNLGVCLREPVVSTTTSSFNATIYNDVPRTPWNMDSTYPTFFTNAETEQSQTEDAQPHDHRSWVANSTVDRSSFSEAESIHLTADPFYQRNNASGFNLAQFTCRALSAK
jgi:hypothetical protein